MGVGDARTNTVANKPESGERGTTPSLPRPESPGRCRGRLRYRKFMSSVAGYYPSFAPPADDGSSSKQQRLTPLYDTIVSSRNCRRSHLSPFPLPCKHTPAHFPPVNSSVLSIRPTPDVPLLPPGAARRRSFSSASSRYHSGLSP